MVGHTLPSTRLTRAERRRKEAAERVTLDFLELGGEGISRGVTLHDCAARKDVLVHHLNQLLAGRAYETRRGVALRRAGARAALLGGSVVLAVDPQAVVESSTLLEYVRQPLPASERDLRLGFHPGADEREVPEWVAPYRYRAGRAAWFLATRLDEERRRVQAGRDGHPMSVSVSAEVSRVEEAVAGARLVSRHTGAGAEELAALGAPEGATQAVSVELRVRDGVKDFRVGTFSGALKAVLGHFADQLRELLPDYAGYKTALVKDRQPRVYRVTAFFGGRLSMEPETVRLLHRFEARARVGRSGPRNGDGGDSSWLGFFPSSDEFAAEAHVSVRADELVVALAKRVCRGLFASPDTEAAAVRWLDLAYVLDRVAVDARFRDAAHLAEHQVVGEASRTAYEQHRELAASVAEALEGKARQAVAESYDPATSKLYDRFRTAAQACFDGVAGAAHVYGDLRTSLELEGGERLFDVLPSRAEIDEMLRELPPPPPAAPGAAGRLAAFGDADFEALLAALAGPADEPEWTVATDRPGCRVCSRPADEAGMPFLLRTEIEVSGGSVERVWDMLSDADTRVSWDTYLTESRTLEELPGGAGRVVYLRYWVPVGVDHREFVEVWQHRRLPGGGVACLARSVEHPLAPQRKGHVRGHTYRMGTVVRPADGGGVSVAGVAQQDYGGRLPRSLILFMMRTAFAGWAVDLSRGLAATTA